ncbi:RNA polymerase sigma factor [Xanthomarina sp. GH4-25]|uniref:RNA polymerase sigma factor n=1 Tax=Xanthomarina sp. GH4-25 TaxID=3349335 RepID=UPI000D677B6A|nr:RNA polymerase subunit sigma-24 [Flavobacteriaceae bacterium LYZ1037]
MQEKFLETDKDLIQQYQSGDTKALQKLVKRWHKTFCNKAYWLIKDADVSKDIAQDTWKTIIIKLEDLKDPSSFSSWATRIIYSKSFDWLKNQKRTQSKHEAYQYTFDSHEEDTENREVLKQQLKKAIKTLPTQQEMVIKLFYMEAYSLKEISNTLNISVGTTKSRLFHAREKLKQIIKT